MKFVFILLTGLLALAANKDLVNDKSGLAIGGYDVVAYFQDSATKGVKGNKTIYSKYNNHTYRFSSEKNKQLFDEFPEKYLPEYGGWCAWAVAEGDTNVAVNYNTFLIAPDSDGKERLYLFYNSWGINTLKKWKNKQHKELVSAADKVWLEFIK